MALIDHVRRDHAAIQRIAARVARPGKRDADPDVVATAVMLALDERDELRERLAAMVRALDERSDLRERLAKAERELGLLRGAARALSGGGGHA